MKKVLVMAAAFILLISLAGCGAHVSEADALADHAVTVQADSEIKELEKGLSAAR